MAHCACSISAATFAIIAFDLQRDAAGVSSIRILGIEGVDESKLGANMPPLLTGGRACAITHVEPKAPPAQEKNKDKDKGKLPSLLLESPVRSGQSIVFAEGDVTVLGSVGSGAEIVAVRVWPAADYTRERLRTKHGIDVPEPPQEGDE